MTSWKEAQDAEGRSYFYDEVTRETRWEKPEELWTNEERRARQLGWLPALSQDGKGYWYHTETGETRWEVGDVLEDGQESVQEGAEEPEIQGKTTEGEHPEPREKDKVDGYENRSEMLRAVVLPKTEAEPLFLAMLNDHNVDATWSFNKIIELGCSDARYWCIDDDPLWKRAMFDKYLSTRSQEQLLREHSAVSKFQDAFVAALKRNGNIRYYTRWPTARRLLANEPVYTHSVVSEKLKRRTFQDYVATLRRDHDETSGREHMRAVTELREYLRQIAPDSDHVVSWQQLYDNHLFENADRFMSNKRFALLSKEDVLREYLELVQDHTNTARSKLADLQRANYTHDRVCRDNFKVLLTEISSTVHSTTKWSEVYPKIHKDPRFLAILGRDGSSALDLFRDLVDEKALQLQAHKSVAQQLLNESQFVWSGDTAADEKALVTVLQAAGPLSGLDATDRALLATQLERDHRARVAQQAEAATRLREQRLRLFTLLLQRVFASRGKPATWEEAALELSRYPEAAAIENDQDKRKAFEKWQPAVPTRPSRPETDSSNPGPALPRKRQLTPVELDY
ncbi:LAMI_0A04874g1_1 [Lachancea mirantina]|uniref:LAMI_0A04874g1_1 n=1 Tax=Lachancea mirantina TaxID=1230905 RepID=A0A1G4IPA4_9SACH|nr:LAMI_0A04874g1_1 [Lachancea mirantina]